jgi:hypothetical protein
MPNIGAHRLLYFAFILFWVFLSHAQSPITRLNTGALAGTITDSFEGAPIGGASVQVRSKARHWQTRVSTDNLGHFTLSLTPGDYELNISASGFVSAHSAVSIAAGKTVRHDSKLVVDSKHLEESDGR